MGGRLWEAARTPRAREIYLNNARKEFSYTHGLLKSLGHPRIYQLETTNHCPYTCNMCPRTHAMTRPLGHMDIGLFRAILDQVQPAWQTDDVSEDPSIGLWHFGEPMLYKHFAESISYCHQRGLRAILSTNPSIWSDHRIDEVLEVGVDEMYVMFDGMDDATSMAIRGKVASFTRGEANLRKLLQRKIQMGLDRPHIHVSMIKQSRNAHQWKQFKAYWTGMAGVDKLSLCDLSTFAHDVPQLVTISELLGANDPIQAAAVERSNRMAKLPCYYPWHSFTIAWDGKVVPCCRDHNAAAVLGDASRESLEEIWNGPAMQDLRGQFLRNRVSAAPCATCTERSSEIGLPGRFYPFSLTNAKRVVAHIRGTSYP